MESAMQTDSAAAHADAQADTAWQLDHRLAQFLYHEADLLDSWRLDDWLELFTDDAVYVVPATDHSQPDAARDLTLIHDDRKRLAYRVGLLLGERAWAENPPSRTRRMIANVRLASRRDGTLRVASNFMIHRFRHGGVHTFIGRYEHELVTLGERLRIRRRTATLDHETLTPHGMVSIIL